MAFPDAWTVQVFPTGVAAETGDVRRIPYRVSILCRRRFDPNGRRVRRATVRIATVDEVASSWCKILAKASFAVPLGFSENPRRDVDRGDVDQVGDATRRS